MCFVRRFAALLLQLCRVFHGYSSIKNPVADHLCPGALFEIAGVSRLCTEKENDLQKRAFLAAEPVR